MREQSGIGIHHPTRPRGFPFAPRLAGLAGAGRCASDWRTNDVFKRLARCFLDLAGWEVVGTKIANEKLVLVAGPHTSNWDLVYLLAVTRALDVKVSWLGKHSMFWWPLGPILRALGGVPVRRDRPEKAVDQIVRAFEEAKTLCLAITPEGTRSHTPYWKSGFHRIARAAGVPIQLGFADYSERRAGFGPSFAPSDDVRADMDGIRAFFAGVIPRHPDKLSRIRLREEDE